MSDLFEQLPPMDLVDDAMAEIIGMAVDVTEEIGDTARAYMLAAMRYRLNTLMKEVCGNPFALTPRHTSVLGRNVLDGTDLLHS